ncbi:cyclase family protein [Actinoplanes bogorensis]|uniref:Cyclase family protein n=1 Tax=Paractinoplanes bogorensis TaxID=1610840 RepID=A0ABS5Z395_9ACTN|nr:cyclase family protein [Actinoplanes bogorensis]MBU2668895.1 cyclase family protein [Actinoplanes bogorensis]
MIPDGSVWAEFGPGDQVGAVNRQTPSRVRRAAALVRTGSVFSLNWDLALPDPPILGRGSLRHHPIDLGNGWDDKYDNFHPQSGSQWDGLSHVRHPKFGFYQGHTDEQVRDAADPKLGIDHWARRGLAGRWVLADLATDCSVQTAFTADQVQAALDRQGVSVEEGDILLLHFGWTTWYETLDADARAALTGFFPAPGLAAGPEMAEWLTGLRLSAIAADCPAVESMPFDMSSSDTFLHDTLIPLQALAVGEMFHLGPLAAHCAADGVYEGLFTAAPLNVRGAAGSTANALALK